MKRGVRNVSRGVVAAPPALGRREIKRIGDTFENNVNVRQAACGPMRGGHGDAGGGGVEPKQKPPVDLRIIESHMMRTHARVLIGLGYFLRLVKVYSVRLVQLLQYHAIRLP